MYYQVEQVLEKQEPEIEKFYKGRGILICESKQNLFALKEYSGSLQKAEFLYWLGICLEQQGIRCDAMLKNKEGALLTEGVDHVFYTFHRWMRGRECEVNNRVDLPAGSFVSGTVSSKLLWGRICQCVRTEKCIGAEKYGKCGGRQ